jgi:hypothetical protein
LNNRIIGNDNFKKLEESIYKYFPDAMVNDMLAEIEIVK